MSATKPAVRAIWASNAAAGSLVDPDVANPLYTSVGWPVSSVPPARQYWNWAFNYCTNAIQYFIRRGISDWDIAQTYQLNDVVVSSDGIVRQSLQNSNIGNPPPTSSAWWGPLNGYALSGVLGGYVTTAQLNTALGGYTSTAALNALLSNYVTSATLANYYTKTQTNALFTPYWTSTTTTNYLAANYVSNSLLTAALAPYISAASVAALYPSFAYLGANYYNQTQCNQNFDTITDVNNKLGSYAPLTQFNTVTAQNGAYSLPGGTLVKYGYVAFTGASPITVPLTVGLPFTAAYNVQITPIGGVTAWDVASCSLTAMTFNCGSGASGFYWQVIGRG